MAAYEPLGSLAWLNASPLERTLTSEDLLSDLRSLPAATVPPVVVLDDAARPPSNVVKAAWPGLARQGLSLSSLPPYRPELHRIESVFKQVKHHDIPQRSHTSKADLRVSVTAGFDAFRLRLLQESNKQPRLAA